MACIGLTIGLGKSLVEKPDEILPKSGEFCGVWRSLLKTCEMKERFDIGVLLNK